MTPFSNKNVKLFMFWPIAKAFWVRHCKVTLSKYREIKSLSGKGEEHVFVAYKVDEFQTLLLLHK